MTKTHEIGSSANAMTLVLVRHGETYANLTGMYDGGGYPPGIGLTNLGKRQAMEIAETLKDMHFNAIFYSDLTRAADTANAIHKYHENENILFMETQQLREIKGGLCERRELGSMKAVFEIALGNGNSELVGKYLGESRERFHTRINGFLQRLYEDFAGKTVLLVCHAGVINAIQSIWHDTPIERICDYAPVPNGQAMTLEFTKKQLRSQNQQHIAALARL